MPTLTVTRITHACTLLDLDGQLVLTDPWFTQRPTYHPGEPIALQPNQLPPLAAVVISHGHYDHCDLRALGAYPDKTVPLVVKRGLAAKVRRAGFGSLTELDPWQQARLGGLTITAAPAKHQIPEVTFVLQVADVTVFFGADTLLVPELAEVATRYPGIDLALLPINGLRIRPLGNRQVVMTAAEAATLTSTLQPAHAVPIHYTFAGGWLADRLLINHDGRPEVYRDAVADQAPHTSVHILPPGQPLTL